MSTEDYPIYPYKKRDDDDVSMREVALEERLVTPSSSSSHHHNVMYSDSSSNRIGDTRYYSLSQGGQRQNNDNNNRTRRIVLIALVASMLLLSAVIVATIIISVSVVAKKKGGVKPLPSEHFANETTVILISIDGFRWDYWDMYDAEKVMPTLKKLRDEGTHAEWINPIFPSKTFPNHYTLVTGLYAESHGIVSNRFYDPVTDKTFSLSSPQSAESHWWLGEPIWVTSVLQNKPVNCCFWPGCNAKIKGVYPTYNKEYDQSFPYNGRVDRVLEFLSVDKKQDIPRLSLTYFEGVDTQGHRHGPGSKEVERALTEVDNSIARLLEGLEKRNIAQYVDIIILSDHGMASISNDRSIDVTDVAEKSDAKQYNFGPFGDYWPANTNNINNPEAIEQMYKSISEQIPREHAVVYKRDEIPDEYHFKNNPRVPPVLSVAKIEEGGAAWSFTTRDFQSSDKGNHGWAPEYQEMKAIFFARGPNFKEGFKSGAFDNVHVYSLLAHILELEPAPTNGTIADVKHLLRRA